MDRLRALTDEVMGRFVRRALGWPWLANLPNTKRRRGFPAPWPDPDTDTDDSLRTVPGISRDEAAADLAHAEVPLYSFTALHRDKILPATKYLWTMLVPELARFHRIDKTIKRVLDGQPSSPPPAVDAAALTAELRTAAHRLGISAIGFAPYDPRYVFAEVFEEQPDATMVTAESGAAPDPGTVIVCILEQGWDATQTIPSLKAEREAIRTYEGLVDLCAELASVLHSKGFRAQVGGPSGPGVSIHYAVEAGLGQLGLNGQLLTPQAGSRCRISLITTNATLVHDEPVDFGVNAICDACTACVRRCPPGAIPQRRAYSRGVLKAKIKSERCFPILMQAHGCAICMKVCPVQRYGLDAVKSHYLETGEILGKGTDELEGYHWPLDGRHYGPGQKPRISSELLDFGIDPQRTKPPTAEAGAGKDAKLQI